MASEIPVFPLVGSSSSRPGSSSPEASAAAIIFTATRSLIDPVGFWPSSLAYRRTPSGESLVSSTSGVRPTSSRTELAATGHRRQEDDRAAGHRGLESLSCADVLALDVDVDEARQCAVVVDAVSQLGKPAHQVVQELADGGALRLQCRLPPRLLPQRRRDPDDCHEPGTPQNST